MSTIKIKHRKGERIYSLTDAQFNDMLRSMKRACDSDASMGLGLHGIISGRHFALIVGFGDTPDDALAAATITSGMSPRRSEH